MYVMFLFFRFTLSINAVPGGILSGKKITLGKNSVPEKILYPSLKMRVKIMSPRGLGKEKKEIRGEAPKEFLANIFDDD